MVQPPVDGLVTLQERTVNLINQLNMPLVEVSLVLQKHINQLMDTLQSHLDATGQTVPETVHTPWPLASTMAEQSASFELEKVLKIIDHQRMDILETLIRVTLVDRCVACIAAMGAPCKNPTCRSNRAGSAVLAVGHTGRLVVKAFKNIGSEAWA